MVLPRFLQIGAGASAKIGSVLESLSLSRPLIINGKTVVNLGYIQKFKVYLDPAKIKADVYDDTVTEPTVDSLKGGVEMVANGNYDCLVKSTKENSRHGTFQ